MTKKELIDKIAEQNDDLTKKKVEDIVGSVFTSMEETLQGGGKVAWPGFGAFSVTERAARQGRNPRTGDPIQIAASKSVKFKVSGTLKGKL